MDLRLLNPPPGFGGQEHFQVNTPTFQDQRKAKVIPGAKHIAQSDDVRVSRAALEKIYLTNGCQAAFGAAWFLFCENVDACSLDNVFLLTALRLEDLPGSSASAEAFTEYIFVRFLAQTLLRHAGSSLAKLEAKRVILAYRFGAATVV